MSLELSSRKLCSILMPSVLHHLSSPVLGMHLLRRGRRRIVIFPWFAWIGLDVFFSAIPFEKEVYTKSNQGQTDDPTGGPDASFCACGEPRTRFGLQRLI